MVILREGNSKPELRMALRTRSLLSLTTVSGKPTMAKPGKPLDKWVSTVTLIPATPSAAHEYNLANAMTH